MVNELKKKFYTNLNKILALPLLPADKIDDGLTDVKKSIRIITAPFAKATKKKFNDLLKYIKKYWIGQWKAENFTCHGEINRTNNAIESYHMGLNKLFRKNPSPSLFLRNYVLFLVFGSYFYILTKIYVFFIFFGSQNNDRN